MENLKELFQGKHILVTGGLGSIGSAIVKEILPYEPRLVTIADNRETAMFYGIWENRDSRVEYVFVDVRDENRLKRITQGVDIVFHAAAMKHVLVCERNPEEAVATNVGGTQNVMSACLANNVEKMIFISTDKVVNPTNVLGTTKLQAERLIGASRQSRAGKGTKFGAVRFG